MASEPRYLSLPQLFSSKLYRIPDYQRGYAWSRRQLDDLWTDLEVLEEGAQHFTGMIVVKRRQERYNDSEMRPYEELEVIDGQQRLTTLILMMQSIIRGLRESGDEEATRQSDNLHDVFIGQSGWFRLGLNDDSRVYFEHLLDVGEPLVTVENGSQQNLLNAVRYFRERVDALDKTPESRLAGIRRLVARLQQSLRFVFYQVDNDAEAGLIFEVMNNRGKDLSQADRLKNYLLYLAHKIGMPEESVKSLAQQWGLFFKQVMQASPEGTNSEEIEGRILRNHWILYKEADIPTKYKGLPISQRIKQEMLLSPTEPDQLAERNERLSQEAMRYTRSLTTIACHFAEISNPEGPKALSWVTEVEVKQQLKDELLSFHRMGHTATVLPLLLAGRARLASEPMLMLELARALSAFAFRSNAICNRRSQTGQPHLRRQARHLMKADADAVPAVALEIIGDIYEWIRWYGCDEDVRDFLRDDVFYESHRPQEIRYLFYEYEKELCHGQKPAVDWATFADSRKHQVEHIWPQATQWLGGNKKTHAENVGRLGNLTVTHFNQTLGTKPFLEKAKIYASSNLLVENRLQHYEQWGVEELKAREEELVNFVLRRWRIPDIAETTPPGMLASARFYELLEPAKGVLGKAWVQYPSRNVKNYRGFWPKGENGGVHYELCYTDGYVLMDIHIERDECAHMAALFEEWSTSLEGAFGEGEVEFDPTWWNGLGRLSVKFDAATTHSELLSAWKTLISLTRDSLWPSETGKDSGKEPAINWSASGQDG